MKKLLELEEKLRKAKEDLEKNMLMGYPDIGADPSGVNMGKKEHEDEKEDKKMIEEKLDEHNEKKHGEPKDEDSAMKAEITIPKRETKKLPKLDEAKFKEARTARNQELKDAADEQHEKAKQKAIENPVAGIKRIKKAEDCEVVKFDANGQWSMQ